MVLTPQGQEIFEYAKAIIYYQEQIKQKALELSSNKNLSVKGDIQIFAASAFNHLLYLLTKNLKKTYPNIILKINFFEPAHLNYLIEHCMQENVIYMSFFDDIPSFSSKCKTIFLPKERVLLSCSHKSPLKHYQHVSYQSLQNMPVIFEQSDENISPLMLDIFAKRGVTFNNKMLFSSAQFCSNFLIDGEYVALSLESSTKTTVSNDYHHINIEENIYLTPIILIPETFPQKHYKKVFLEFLSVFPLSL